MVGSKKVNPGDLVEYIGGILPWNGAYSPGEPGRMARVIEPVEGAQYFLGRWDIDTCIEWVDVPKDAPASERFRCTSSKRLRLWDKDDERDYC